jgi:hypothetical protein
MSDENTDFVVVPFNPLRHEDDAKALADEKEFIRSRIIGKSNEQIVQDQEAMDELTALGSDLNINAFTCNFKINGVPNTDPEEANYLNNRIFDRLSLTKTGEEPMNIPLFLSSSVFAQKDYDKCLKNFMMYPCFFIHTAQS